MAACLLPNDSLLVCVCVQQFAVSSGKWQLTAADNGNDEATLLPRPSTGLTPFFFACVYLMWRVMHFTNLLQLLK